ncbi:MAG: Asparagine synthetase [glutamine-hydrolyzing] 1 [Phycisphaerae bacterium]|nr:Asparagine synthetase [glutamine-hydrolyzing] 1 [Phycisphaerae bacterium]
MCGIAGIWGNARTPQLRAMADALRHRGPDDEGLWISPRADFGFAQRRLSIIDLGGGHQPIFNETGRIAVVFNGEIYNYKELRAELLKRGHVLKTESDTECIVHLYEDHGADFVSHLRGMFAIALWDDDKQELLLARDRAGKKPLYVAQTAGEFYFGSEIKSVVAGLRTATSPPALTIDDQTLSDYLAWGEIHAPATIYNEIRSLEPAELVVVRDRRIRQRSHYWQLEMLPKTPLNPHDALQRVDQLVREAVTLRLRSDVPVGTFLSGGIDSGIVTAIAAENYPGRLITVTIGVEDDAFDERPLARLVAQRYNTQHHEVLVRPDVVNDLPKIAAAYDQPFAGPSCIPSYYVARAARQFVKVVLNGDGGDEVFAGYRRYVAARLNRWLQATDNPVGRPLWRALAAVMPTPREYRSGYAFAHRFARGMGLDPVQRYLTWSLDLLSDDEKREMCAAANGHVASGESWLQRTLSADRLIAPFVQRFAACGPVDRMLGTDFSTILPHELLVKMDIACMAHSLEARSPLLDHVLIEHVARFPEHVKLAGTRTKPLLRTLSRRYLPESIRSAPKRGFEVPLLRWLRGDLRPMCEDILLSRSGLLAERFQRAARERLVRGGDGLDPRRWSRRVWTLLMLGIWDAQVRPRA